MLGEATNLSVALWRIAENDAAALAMFSGHEAAEAYGEANCMPPFRILQVENQSLVRIFIDCHQQGIEYAVLDPSQSSTRQVFVVAQILRAARNSLATRNT